MEAAIGRAPPLTEDELLGHMRLEALDIERRFQGKNREALLNVMADATSGSVLFVMLLHYTEGRGALFRTVGRVFSGLSDTAKAFLIIAATDILLGYHSEEGWTAAIRVITGHYGAETEVRTCAALDIGLGVDQCRRAPPRCHMWRMLGPSGDPHCVEIACPAEGEHLPVCGDRAGGDGHLLQVLDLCGAQPARPGRRGHAEEHGPALSFRMRATASLVP